MEKPMSDRPAIIPALCYVNPKAALEYLRDAFGFELELLIEDEKGNLAHSQMSYGNGAIMVGNEWSADHKSPASIGRKCTQTVHLHVDENIDAHCERARKAGMEILQPPETQFYGDRTYRARDPEGHIWTFGQSVEAKTPEEWDKGTGLKTWAKKTGA
jgi:uncharacterized glyoxalase superfamily protein PhnB